MIFKKVIKFEKIFKKCKKKFNLLKRLCKYLMRSVVLQNIILNLLLTRLIIIRLNQNFTHFYKINFLFFKLILMDQRIMIKLKKKC